MLDHSVYEHDDKSLSFTGFAFDEGKQHLANQMYKYWLYHVLVSLEKLAEHIWDGGLDLVLLADLLREYAKDILIVLFLICLICN